MDQAGKKSRSYLNVPPIPESIWQHPLHFIAFGFGSGACPFAPGTLGTLFAVPFYLIACAFGDKVYAFLTLIFVLMSIYVCAKASQAVLVDDHQGMCLDEFAGFFVTMLFLPHTYIWIIAGFILFRLFDIWKPWPISYIDQHMHGGFGMIFDDVIAGVFACAILQMFKFFVQG